MQLGNRDIILAATPDALQRASSYFADRRAAAFRFVEQMEKLSKSAENQERIAKLKQQIEILTKGKELLEGVRKQAIPLEARRAAGDFSSEVSEQIGKLANEIVRIRNEIVIPANTESEAIANKIVDHSKSRAEEATGPGGSRGGVGRAKVVVRRHRSRPAADRRLRVLGVHHCPSDARPERVDGRTRRRQFCRRSAGPRPQGRTR